MTAAMDESLITTPAQLLELVRHVRAAGRFGFDTEFVSEETFEPVLCLIQVATPDRLAVIDPQTVRDLGPFWELVHDSALDVVMHAAGEDMRICLLRTGTLPRRIFDVQIAAGLVGYSYPLSLVNLIAQVLRISLPGSETRTDWRRRPLSPAQLRYALDDVRYLLDLADRLGSELQQLRRTEWAEAEFADFLESVEDRADEERWRRLPGLHQLSRRGLETARRLSAWREDDARRQNRPLRQIMRDDVLVAIAKRQPTSRRELEALRDFNRPALLSKSQTILMVLDQARAVPEDQLPELSARPDDSPGAATVANLLSAALAQLCIQERVAGSLVANVADLKHLIRWYLDGRPDHDRPALLRGWRDSLCGELLLEVLEGRRTFRVVDPASEFPWLSSSLVLVILHEGIEPMARTISCFTNSFGESGVWTAVERIRQTGIDHLELALRGHNFGGLVIPESAVITEKADDATARSFVDHLARHGVKISGCNVGGADLRTAQGVELTERRIRFAARWFAVKVCVSGAGQPANDSELQTIVSHLRRLGDTAAAEGIRLALETHKGPTQNAAAMLALMTEVDHPNVRLNFDTGNIAYYNQGFDPCDELEKVKHLVSNVHLKDNRGGFEDWYFPAVGDGGAVDFVRIRDILDRVGFEGPYTVEIEGIGGEPQPGLDQRMERIARSATHLRGCGYFDL